jgi:tetratricopeptide (TPR) repeat protein
MIKKAILWCFLFACPIFSHAADEQTQFLRAATYYQENKWKEAAQLYAGLGGTPTSPWSPYANTMAGVSEMKAENYEAAEKYFKKNLKSKNTDCLVRSALGLSEVYLRTSTPTLAVEICDTVLPRLKEATDRAPILLIRGVAYQRQWQTQAALQDFTDVALLDVTPWSGRSLLLRAATLWFAKDNARLTNSFVADLDVARLKPTIASNQETLDQCDLLIGHAHLKQKEYIEAEQRFRKILEKETPADVRSQALSGLASSLSSQHRFGEAEKYINELLVHYKNDQPIARFALLSQAHLFWNRGDYGAALDAYEKYAQLFPIDKTTAQAVYMSGRTEEKLAHTAHALERWDHVRSHFPNSPFAYRSLVRSAALASHTVDAVRAEVYYRELLRTGNSSIREMALLLMGQGQMATRQYEEAIESFDAFLKRFPFSERTMEVRNSLKDAYEQMAKTDPQALECVAQRYAKSSHAGEAFFRLGLMEYDRGNPERALEYFQKVLTRYSGTPSALTALFYQGQTEFQLQRYKEAMVTLGRFVKENPDHDLAFLARFQQGRAMLKIGFVDDAILVFKNITLLAPTSEFAAEAWLSLARAWDEKKNTKEQIHAYEVFVQQFPTHHKVNEVCWKLGNLKQHQGDDAAALTYYQRVVPVKDVVSQEELDAVIKPLEKRFPKRKKR